MNNFNPSNDIIVIGAGLSGLQFANSFSEGLSIYEKSRGTLGRISSRRMNDSEFIKGAAKIDFLEDEFLSFLKDIDPEGIDLTSDKAVKVTPRLRKKLKEYFSRQVIQTGHRVESIENHEDHLNLHIRNVSNDEKKEIRCKGVVLTGPTPQMLELIPSSIDQNNLGKLKNIQYEMKGVVCATLESDIKKLKEENEFELIHDDDHGAVFVISNDQITSREGLIDSIKSKLNILDDDIDAPRMHIHFWKYSNCKNPLKENFYNIDNKIFFIGDSFSNGGAQGAWKSANALATELKNLFGETND